MASIVTPTNATADPAAGGAPLVAAAFTPQECAYCRAPVESGTRWVREKIYEPLTGNVPRYHRYHGDLFAREELSCWEKHETEREIGRAAARAALQTGIVVGQRSHPC